jgi:flagellar basal body rod protein FlgC
MTILIRINVILWTLIAGLAVAQYTIPREREAQVREAAERSPFIRMEPIPNFERPGQPATDSEGNTEYVEVDQLGLMMDLIARIETLEAKVAALEGNGNGR